MRRAAPHRPTALPAYRDQRGRNPHPDHSSMAGRLQTDKANPSSAQRSSTRSFRGTSARAHGCCKPVSPSPFESGEHPFEGEMRNLRVQIHQANIARYQGLMACDLTPYERRYLEQMLEQERTALRWLFSGRRAELGLAISGHAGPCEDSGLVPPTHQATSSLTARLHPCTIFRRRRSWPRQRLPVVAVSS